MIKIFRKNTLNKSRGKWNLVEVVEETFFPIIQNYKTSVDRIGDKVVVLTGSNFLIDISCHMGETYVHIKENKDDQARITPYLWACYKKQIDYRKVIPNSYPSEMTLGEIARHDLFLECTYLRLFCTDLLEGDFSKKNQFLNLERSLLLEMNEYWREEQSRNQSKH